MKLDIVNIGDLPGRTSVELAFSLPGVALGFGRTLVNAETARLTYTCLDCPYSTEDCAAMQEHQNNQTKYHTLRQRLRRWRNMRRGNG